VILNTSYSSHANVKQIKILCLPKTKLSTAHVAVPACWEVCVFNYTRQFLFLLSDKDNRHIPLQSPPGSCQPSRWYCFSNHCQTNLPWRQKCSYIMQANFGLVSERHSETSGYSGTWIKLKNADHRSHECGVKTDVINGNSVTRIRKENARNKRKIVTLPFYLFSVHIICSALCFLGWMKRKNPVTYVKNWTRLSTRYVQNAVLWLLTKKKSKTFWRVIWIIHRPTCIHGACRLLFNIFIWKQYFCWIETCLMPKYFGVSWDSVINRIYFVPHMLIRYSGLLLTVRAQKFNGQYRTEITVRVKLQCASEQWHQTVQEVWGKYWRDLNRH
jgi:hypothetical protein